MTEGVLLPAVAVHTICKGTPGMAWQVSTAPSLTPDTAALQKMLTDASKHGGTATHARLSGARMARGAYLQPSCDVSMEGVSQLQQARHALCHLLLLQGRQVPRGAQRSLQVGAGSGTSALHGGHSSWRSRGWLVLVLHAARRRGVLHGRRGGCS